MAAVADWPNGAGCQRPMTMLDSECADGPSGGISYFGVGSKLNGVTETDILPSANCWTVKLTSFEAFVSPTVTEIEPLHDSVRLSLLVDVVTILSPRRYSGCRFDFSLSGLTSLGFAGVEFSAAYFPSALLWSSETALSTALRVSKESHSGFAPQPLRAKAESRMQTRGAVCFIRGTRRGDS